MAEGYYPEFYLKKRQRERIYAWIWTGAKFLALIVLGLLGALIFFKTVIAPRNAESGATEKLAGERGELRTQQRLEDLDRQSAQNPAAQDQTPAAKAPELSSLPYGRSLPEIGISVSAGSPADAADATGGASTPPDDNNAVLGPDASGQAGAVEGDAQAGAADNKESSKEPPAATKPDEDKPKEQPKPADKPKAAEKPKTEKPKPQEKPKAETKPAEKKTDSGKSAGSKSGAVEYTFNVYAGGYLTREAAESQKSGLGAAGMSGTVLEKGGSYLLFIGTVPSYDQANALKSKLQQNGFDKSFFTRLPKKH